MDVLGLSSAQSLQALSALLSPQEEPSDDQSVSSNLGPGHIGPLASETKDGSLPFL